MKPPPPRPEAKGSTTPSARDTATAASTALPPSARTSRPASAASGCAATTMPFSDRATFMDRQHSMGEGPCQFRGTRYNSRGSRREGMETTQAAVSFHLLSDEELISLLRTEEDRLPRPIVDEFVRRGERIVDPLVRMCRDEGSWAAEPPAAWAPLHAVLILGAIGSPRALPGLLAAVREAAARQLGGTAAALVNILGAIGRGATGPLKIRALDAESPAAERTLSVDALAAVAARTPIEQGEILDF